VSLIPHHFVIASSFYHCFPFYIFILCVSNKPIGFAYVIFGISSVENRFGPGVIIGEALLDLMKTNTEYSIISIVRIAIVRGCVSSELLRYRQGRFYAGYKIRLSAYRCVRMPVLPFTRFLCVFFCITM
jgi:hypothetical protein